MVLFGCHIIEIIIDCETSMKTYGCFLALISGNTYMSEFMVEKEILCRLCDLISFPCDELSFLKRKLGKFTAKQIRNQRFIHCSFIQTLFLKLSMTDAALPVQLMSINPKQRAAWANPKRASTWFGSTKWNWLEFKLKYLDRRQIHRRFFHDS